MGRLKKTKRFRNLIIFFLLGILLVIGYIYFNRLNSVQSPLPESLLERVSVRNIENELKLDGNIFPRQTELVAIPSGYEVREIKVAEGEVIDEGQELVIIRSLSTLRNESIYSPIPGIVKQINLKESDKIASPLADAFKIQNEDFYKIKTTVNENDIAKLTIGQTVSLTVPAISEEVVEGTIAEIAEEGTIRGGAVEFDVVIEANILPEGSKYGMSANISIITASKQNVLAVPENYLIDKDGKTYVKLVQYSDLEKTAYTISDVEVTTGLETEDYTEITSGIKEFDLLLEPSFTVERSFGLFNF